ncbi:hypothetical protein KFE98_18540 [bacterium SCSIO 12741]|nr:hypothetical protein KFE98_18540 [bacterium SCSIO 12741]
MKIVSVFLAVSTLLLFSSCEKLDFGKGGKGTKCQKYVYEDLVFSEQCGCIVSGKVKYVKGKTLALVDYGDGSCDNEAVKTVCYQGDCYHKKATKHVITIDCQQKSVAEGEVEESEALSPELP